MDGNAARLVHTALKQYERRLFTGDQAGRILEARCLDLMAHLEAGMPELKEVA
jgi:hypothetical protein